MRQQSYTSQGHRKPIIEDVFDDAKLFKHRSQSNLDQLTPLAFEFNPQKVHSQSRKKSHISMISQQTLASRKSIVRIKKPSVMNRDEIIKQMVDAIKDEFEEQDTILELFENQVWKQFIQSNKLLVEQKRSLPSDPIKDDIYIMVHNYLKRIKLTINQENNSSTHLRKAQKRLALHMITQFQDLVNHLILAISKVDHPLAIMIEETWKYILLTYEFFDQNSVAEFENLKENLLTELQGELTSSRKENQELYNKCAQLQNDLKRQKEKEKEEITAMQYRLHQVKGELNDAKMKFEQMSTFEHAEGCMRDVDKNIKETNEILHRIEYSVNTRDREMFHSLNNVITQYKITREGELGHIAKMNKQFKFPHQQPKMEAILSEVFFSHPFLEYMKPTNKEPKLDLLLEWFHKECKGYVYGNHPLLQSLEQFSMTSSFSIPQLFINYLNQTHQIDELPPIIQELSRVEPLSEINQMNRNEKQVKLQSMLFVYLFVMDPNIVITIEKFQRIKKFYQSLKMTQSENDTPRVDNKFTWYSFVVSNLPDSLCILTDEPEKISQQQASVAQLIVQSIQIENEKFKANIKSIIDLNILKEQEQNQESQIIKLQDLVPQLKSFQMRETKLQLFITLLYERNLKLSINKQRKSKKKAITNALDIQDWNSFLTELLQSLIIYNSLRQGFLIDPVEKQIQYVASEIKEMLRQQSATEKKNLLSKVVKDAIQLSKAQS